MKKPLFSLVVVLMAATEAISPSYSANHHHHHSHHVRRRIKRRLQHHHQPPRMKNSVEQLLVSNGWISSSAASSSETSLTGNTGFWNGFLGSGGSSDNTDGSFSSSSSSCESYFEQYRMNLRHEMDGVSIKNILHNNNHTSIRDTSIVLLDQYRAGLLPFVYKIFLDKSEEDEYFGANGEYTNEFLLRYPQMEDFWSTSFGSSSDQSQDKLTNHSILLGAHGSMLRNTTSLKRALEFLFVFDAPSELDDAVTLVQDLIETYVPGGYNNPLFTLNAYAHQASTKHGTYDSVVIGDGALHAISQANVALNLLVNDSSTSTDDNDSTMLRQANFVLAHEFAHQLQFLAGIHVDNVVKSTTTVLTTDELQEQVELYNGPLRNRNYELLADALASYYLAHPQGAGMQVDLVKSWVAVAYAFGGCNTTKATFHGTPLQRSCVATWGAHQALLSSDSSSNALLSFHELVQRYRLALPQLLSLDPSVCSFETGITKQEDESDVVAAAGTGNEETLSTASTNDGEDDNDEWERSNENHHHNNFHAEHMDTPPETNTLPELDDKAETFPEAQSETTATKSTSTSKQSNTTTTSSTASSSMPDTTTTARSSSPSSLNRWEDVWPWSAYIVSTVLMLMDWRIL